MKKVLGIVLSAAMIMSALPANAETGTKKYSGDSALVPTGWIVNYDKEEGGLDWDLNKEYLGINAYDTAKDGTNALCINVEKDCADNRSLNLSVGCGNLEENATYRIGFWIKGEATEIDTLIQGWMDPKSNLALDYTKGETVDGWTNYYRDTTIGEDTVNWIRFKFKKKTNILLDDISMRKVTEDGLGDNLIGNASFESTATKFVDNNKGNALGVEFWTSLTDDTKDKHSEFLSGDYAHSGSGSLRLKRESEKNLWENVNVNTLFKASDFDESGTYMAEFWIKGTYNTGAQNMRIGLQGGENFVAFQDCEKVDYENGWTKYRGELKRDAGKFSEVKEVHRAYVLVGQVCDLAIDDIKIYSTSRPEVNLFTNGDFENFSASPKNNLKAAAWNVNPSDIAIENGFGTTSYAEPTDEVKYSGKYSMNVHYVADKDIPGSNLIIDTSYGTHAAGTLKISFAVKGFFREDACLINAIKATDWGDRKWLHQADKTTEYLGNGWTKYTITQTTAGETDALQICFLYGAYDMYLDDICVEDASNPGVNLLANGGFEDTKNTTQISDVMVYPTVAENSANVIWTNPANDVSSIKVYFNDTDMNVNANLAPEAHNEILVSGLENNKDYNVKIVATIGGKERVTEIPYTAKNYGAQYAYAKDWLATRNDSASGYANTIFSLDNTEKQSGNYSAKIESLMTEVKTDVYVTLTQNIDGLSTDTIYKVKLKAKTTDPGSQLYIVYESDYPSADNGTKHLFKVFWLKEETDLGNGWKSYSATLDDKEIVDFMNDAREYSAVLRPAINKLNGSMWIDDVELYATDDTTGGAIGNNLIKNSGFDAFEAFEGETSFTDAAGEKVNAIKPGEITATTSIKNNAKGDNFKATVIYALYKNGSLDKIEKVEKVMSQVSYEVPADSFTQTFTIPDDGNKYSIKVMYWNGLESLIPIAEVDKI